MYKIGEFSTLSFLTIKTLRFYDEEGILIPSFRDENNYRYYSEEDLEKISESKIIFHCNDHEFDDDFDDLVFEMEILNIDTK